MPDHCELAPMNETTAQAMSHALADSSVRNPIGMSKAVSSQTRHGIQIATPRYCSIVGRPRCPRCL